MSNTPTRFGVHAGLQNTNVEDLRAIWRRIEELGFEWISIWDHFYAVDGSGTDNLEAVAMHAALACETTLPRCGSLVYCAGYRHPAVLANAIATIDNLSNGRVDLGMGAGWSEPEYTAYGMPFPSVSDRMDILEEAVQCVRGLLRQETTTFEGRFFQLHEARCDPKPIQPELPIWIGGGGEKRTLRIAARFADGWNIPYVGPEVFAHKRDVLHEHCAAVGRDPAEIRCAVNVGLIWTEEELLERFGDMVEVVRPGVLTGSDAQVEDHIAQYIEVGADQINVAIRPPFDFEGLERLARLLPLR